MFCYLLLILHHTNMVLDSCYYIGLIMDAMRYSRSLVLPYFVVQYKKYHHSFS